jgi:SAM-dependent methyltransferase
MSHMSSETGLPKRIAYSRPVRRLHDELLDGIDTLRGRRDSLVPPRRMIYVGVGDYRRVGEEFCEHFKALGGMTPSDDVLDLGCGIGRMAVPLTGWLEGHYEGLDVVPRGIEWCAKTITPRFENFRFQVADVHNAKYNPQGSQSAREYVFPFEDGAFSFVIATSLFTHLLTDEVSNYVSEVARVLRPGGTVLATYFLLDDTARGLLSEGKAKFDFRYRAGSAMTISEYTPEAAIAHDEAEIRACHERCALPIRAVHRGEWSGRENFVSFQDIAIATRQGDRHRS